ncbi:hypothetical protein H0H81_009752 [Sphagnurus paluster]|uniref:Uncharacterized protein n=1 Tax=Sphagnurus paluster TaxID=117069 RepID=A0A9P7K2R6_9AGAR|nr:hypothetical protein H0H81_009752 [Sphagnurus paluster]
MGVVAGGTALGAVLHPILLNHLFYGPMGFHNGVRISAALNTSLMAIANLMMKTRLSPRQTGATIPLVQFSRDPPYVLVVIGSSLFVICGLFLPPFFLQLDAVKHGVDPQLAFYFLSILNAASLCGRIVPGIFAPRFGVFNLLIFFTLAMAILIFCLGAVNDTGGFVAFAIAFGFFSGGGASTQATLVVEIYIQWLGITLTPPMLGASKSHMALFLSADVAPSVSLQGYE